MPSIPGLPRADKPDPTKLYRCLMSFISPQGLISRGDLLRGSNVTVMEHPEFFAGTGLSDEEENALFRERFPTVPFR